MPPRGLSTTRRLLLTTALASVLTGCASTGGGPTPEDVSARVAKESGHRVRPAPAPSPELPAGTSVDDGLSSDEAVAIALWNNPDFQATLAELGIARADVAQAGLLRNPVFTLLLPWGPKQLEATLRWPIEALWQRPRRLKAAQLGAQAVAERLAAGALRLVLDVRLAHVDLGAAQARSVRASETESIARRVAELVRKRYEAGDISRLEADVAAVDADRGAEQRKRVDHDRSLAQHRLHLLLGVGARHRRAQRHHAGQPLPASADRRRDAVRP
jgi:cobalt-zinc-cadmium efflux system outer membrane protein